MTAKRFFLVSVAGICLSGVAQAQPYSPFMPTATNALYAGGINPNPQITSTNISGGRVTIKWNGFLGPYKVQWSTDNWTNWATAGTTNSLARMMSYLCPTGTPTVAVQFRVTGPTPTYSGAYQCSMCHGQAARNWVATPHAAALTSLAGIGEQTNAYCLPCHTVGYRLSTGYSTNKTYLGGVQCENCHGPAGGHAGKYNTPAVTLNSKMCGGCHNGYNPQYDEWFWTTNNPTMHGKTDNMRFASTYLSPIMATSQKRMSDCGPCHAAAVRLALLKEYPKNALPTGSNVVEVGTASCTACHDPHAEHEANGGVHLRNPIYSTNATAWDTSLVTNYYPTWTNWSINASTNYTIAMTNFWLQYDSSIMICGQCHQARNHDQVLTATSKYRNSKPHYSHTYNMNAANIGTTSTNVPMPDMTGVSATSMRHGINTNGETCTTCHMYETPGDVGHTFEVKTNGCYQSGYCHDAGTDPDMEVLVEETQFAISNAVIGVKGMLDTWAVTNLDVTFAGITNIPGKIMVKWEYNGTLGSSAIGYPFAATNYAGTATDQQDKIPVSIRQARQNLYLIWYDGGEGGSMGVHNPEWTWYLINVASNLVLNTP